MENTKNDSNTLTIPFTNEMRELAEKVGNIQINLPGDLTVSDLARMAAYKAALIHVREYVRLQVVHHASKDNMELVALSMAVVGKIDRALDGEITTRQAVVVADKNDPIGAARDATFPMFASDHDLPLDMGEDGFSSPFTRAAKRFWDAGWYLGITQALTEAQVREKFAEYHPGHGSQDAAIGTELEERTFVSAAMNAMEAAKQMKAHAYRTDDDGELCDCHGCKVLRAFFDELPAAQHPAH